MKLEELLNEQETEDKMFQVRVRGNFYGGKYYEVGIDSIFVLASSPEEAKQISEKNIAAVEQHFRNKRYRKGTKTIAAIAKKDKHKMKPSDIGKVTISKQKEHKKVLHRDGTVKPASIQ